MQDRDPPPFAQDEDGAMTVDWVVLTAAIIGLGIAAYASARFGVGSLAGSVETSLEDGDVELVLKSNQSD